MLNENEITLVNNIALAVGKSAEFVTEQYTSWFFVSAVGWVIFGIFSLWSVTKIKFSCKSEVSEWAQWLIKSVLVLISATFILANLPDAINPKAAAIHQIIKDVRPK